MSSAFPKSIILNAKSIIFINACKIHQFKYKIGYLISSDVICGECAGTSFRQATDISAEGPHQLPSTWCRIHHLKYTIHHFKYTVHHFKYTMHHFKCKIHHFK